MEKPSINLKEATIKLGLVKNIRNSNIQMAAIETMKHLLEGHPKAMKISKHNLARYAASLIGYYTKKFDKPKSVIMEHRNLNTFMETFVRSFFVKRGKIVNLQLFKMLFKVNILDKRVSIHNLRENPSPDVVLKYSIQKKPISDFTSEKNLKELQKMNTAQIKLLLTPFGKFNPKLTSIDMNRALQHAVMLTKNFAKTKKATNRMVLATLIEDLQKTSTLNPVYENIRNYYKRK